MNRDVLKLQGNSQRYALDLVVVDEKGAYARGDDEKKESWLGFGVPIVAPAAGTVVEAVGDLPDDIPYDEAKMRENPRMTIGNHVILDHGDGEYSLLAHFRQGSVRVRAGQKVVRGTPLGEMSRSGMGAQLVHLHYELRTSPDLMSGEGLPASFSGFRRIGSSRSESGPLEAGAVVLTDPLPR
jgi:murein DD-endopeptidase MepM/ murein hydrolase activator NlpD